ncbi:hypothetical protein O2W15_17765 [Modestobacter sp. VKM Ac-2979]|uniref:hypothetical protein n=1 Tax=unclassified Modestobacter TaxID=2643866 RepID=UPI0022ABA9A8|nr:MULTISPECIES: hypothetical protein [unclassified Modestobacter]MCZ2813282.1 hypothetical protein [Modestobacter sp. VKM Ac-2979]MCZ2842526.1 hypothetical protein [Modestobacter sp. VKM Ac-2980]
MSSLITILRKAPPSDREESILDRALHVLDERHSARGLGTPVLSDLLQVIREAPADVRRSEVGFYLSLGVKRNEVGLIRGLEGLFLVGLAASLVVSIFVAVSLLRDSYPLFAWSIAIPQAITVLTGAGAVNCVASLLSARLGNAASMVKNR